MSRIGKKPIEVPKGLEITVKKQSITVKGQKGQMSLDLPNVLTLKQSNNSGNSILQLESIDLSKRNKMLLGTYRSHVNNMVIGLTTGFTKILDIVGVGYRANVSGKKLNLQIGFTHPVDFDIPEGVEVETPQPTQIVIKGYNKQVVGQFAANIRKVRPPEPYKGKGIKYSDEIIRRKVGKTAVGGEA